MIRTQAVTRVAEAARNTRRLNVSPASSTLDLPTNLSPSPHTPVATTLPWQRQSAPRSTLDEPLWLEWATLGGLFLFAGWLLGIRGVWGLLFRSDPTGITLVIILLFVAATFWCGQRARELTLQKRLIEKAVARIPVDTSQPGWASEYWRALQLSPKDASAPLDVLLENTHGPHSTAWWVNGIQLKLGLLGKVIGFSILALEIGQLQNFDPAQSQDLLRSLTNGLGVALLTTMVGLVGNILLGLQLTRLDRYADVIVALAQKHGMAGVAAPASSAAASTLTA